MREFLAYHRMTQAAIGRRINKTAASVSIKVAGRQSWALWELRTLAEAVDIDLPEMLAMTTEDGSYDRVRPKRR